MQLLQTMPNVIQEAHRSRRPLTPDSRFPFHAAQLSAVHRDCSHPQLHYLYARLHGLVKRNHPPSCIPSVFYGEPEGLSEQVSTCRRGAMPAPLDACSMNAHRLFGPVSLGAVSIRGRVGYARPCAVPSSEQKPTLLESSFSGVWTLDVNQDSGQPIRPGRGKFRNPPPPLGICCQ